MLFVAWPSIRDCATVPSLAQSPASASWLIVLSTNPPQDVMADHFRPSLLYSAPSRLSSDVPPQRQQDATKRKHHLHRHHHHQHRSSRHHAKEIVQSAFPSQPPTSFGDLLKQAKESISNSPAGSRRASVAVGDGAADKAGQTDGTGGLDIPPLRRPGRPEDLVREQRRVELREEYVSILSSL